MGEEEGEWTGRLCELDPQDPLQGRTQQRRQGQPWGIISPFPSGPFRFRLLYLTGPPPCRPAGQDHPTSFPSPCLALLPRGCRGVAEGLPEGCPRVAKAGLSQGHRLLKVAGVAVCLASDTGRTKPRPACAEGTLSIKGANRTRMRARG